MGRLKDTLNVDAEDFIDVAHSTNEMHEITGNAGVDKDEDCIRFLV